MMTTNQNHARTAKINEELHHRLKLLAARKRLSLQQLVDRLLDYGIKIEEKLQAQPMDQDTRLDIALKHLALVLGDRDRLLERARFHIESCPRCKGQGYWVQHNPHGLGEYGPNKDKRNMDCERCRPDREILADIANRGTVVEKAIKEAP